MSPILALAEGHSPEIINTLMGPAQLAWLIPLLPLVACLLIALFIATFPRSSAGPSATVSILAILGSLCISAAVFLERSAGSPIVDVSVPWLEVLPGHPLGRISLGILIDNLTATMLVMVCFIGLLIQIYSYGYITKEVGHFPTQGSASVSRFFAYLSLFVFSMLGLVLSNNLLQIYIFWELVGVCSYFLIGFWYFKSSAALASKKAFVVTKFADLGFLLGVLSLGLGAGTFNFLALEKTPGAIELTIGWWGVQTALILVFCGAIGKSAQFPLQVWLPDAMEGPTPVSALIHAATMVAAGVYLVARLFPLFFAFPDAGLVVAWIGAITAFVAGSIAVVQNDIKRVLAYSTVSQLGFMIAAIGCGAMTAGTFHLMTHAFFKALLFLGSGAVIVACHTNDMWAMGGLKDKMPITHGTFLVGCLALGGLIPFSGFWSKDEILLGVSGHPLIFLLLVLTAFITAFYVARMYCITFRGAYRGLEHAGEYAGPVPSPQLPPPIEPSKAAFGMERHWTEERAAAEMGQAHTDSHEEGEHGGHGQSGLPPECLGALSEHVPHDHGGHQGPSEVTPWMYVPLLILSIFAFGLGFLGLPEASLGFMTTSNHYEHFVGHSVHQNEMHFNGMLMLGSIIVAVAGLWLGKSMYDGDPMAGEAKLRKLLGMPVVVFLQQKWYFDHLWAELLAKSLYADSRRVGVFEEEFVDRLVYKTGDVTLASGQALRKEQSGLVQKYALQIILAGLVLILSIGVMEPRFLWSLSNVVKILRGGQ